MVDEHITSRIDPRLANSHYRFCHKHFARYGPAACRCLPREIEEKAILNAEHAKEDLHPPIRGAIPGKRHPRHYNPEAVRSEDSMFIRCTSRVRGFARTKISGNAGATRGRWACGPPEREPYIPRPPFPPCGQIDIGNAATELTQQMKTGVPQANGTISVEPTMDVEQAARAGVIEFRPLPGSPPEAGRHRLLPSARAPVAWRASLRHSKDESCPVE